MSRSYTSRAARAGEAHGIDYNFITRTRFEEMIAADAFLEWADVFGNLYGTSAADAEAGSDAGRDLVLVIDVQGARQVRRGRRDRSGCSCCRRRTPCSNSACVGAAPIRESAMQRRLQTARDEVAAFTEYDYVVVNDELDSCVDRMRAIVLAERARFDASRHGRRIVATFTPS